MKNAFKLMILLAGVSLLAAKESHADTDIKISVKATRSYDALILKNQVGIIAYANLVVGGEYTTNLLSCLSDTNGKPQFMDLTYMLNGKDYRFNFQSFKDCKRTIDCIAHMNPNESITFRLDVEKAKVSAKLPESCLGGPSLGDLESKYF